MAKIKELKNETWKLVKLPSQHKSKRYYVSNKTRMKSVDKKTKNETLLNPSPDKYGHLVSVIRLENGKHFACRIYKEIGKHFVEKKSKKHNLLIHKNYKRDDNKISNLKWVTEDDHKKYISKRMKVLGIRPENFISYSKLTAKKVAQIKKSLTKGKTTKQKLAQKFGVSATQINRIATGENWSHVEAAK